MQKIDLNILKAINGLALPGGMNDKQQEDYNNDLNDFVDALPGKSYELTKAFVAMDYKALSEKLTDLAAVLRKIFAAGVAGKCDRLTGAVTEQNKEDIDMLLGNFIAELNALSIDIQLAQYKSMEKRKGRQVRETQTRKNILAVDDVPIVLNALKGVIDGEKYQFRGLTSGKAALQYLETHTPPDLFIVDIEMPEMDGYELTEKIIAKGYDAPVIFLTGNATRESVIKALQAGATDFLVKPVNDGLIMGRLAQYLG